jgi:hypothetical protein
MTKVSDELLPELLEVWRQLDETRRASLIRVARALAEAAPAGEEARAGIGGGFFRRRTRQK